MWSEPENRGSLQERVLECLRAYPGAYVSGNWLSGHLGVSQAATWKGVLALRCQGYQVRAARGLGYCLEGVPDLVLPVEVQRLLQTDRIGRRLHHYHRLGSTNARARELARAGEPEGTVVVAEDQGAGRGRRGRSWFCPDRRGLLFSVILEPRFLTPGQAPLLSLLGAVAVSRLCRDHLGLPAGIKWPNDVLIKGRKVAGTLAELVAEAEQIQFLILGVGLNVNLAQWEFPLSLRRSATSLLQESGRRHRRSRLLAALLEFLEESYRELAEQGPGPLRHHWREQAVGLDGPVTVSGHQELLAGTARDIDQEGALLVEDGSGAWHRVLAGEVSLGLPDR